MRSSIYLAHTDFLNPNEITNTIKTIAQKLNADVLDDADFGMYRDVDDSSSPDLIYFAGLNEDYFLESKREKWIKDGYGCVLTIEHNGQPIAFDFLKLFMEKYPFLLIYNEDVPNEYNSFIFEKKHLDANRENNLNFLYMPPVD